MNMFDYSDFEAVDGNDVGWTHNISCWQRELLQPPVQTQRANRHYM